MCGTCSLKSPWHHLPMWPLVSQQDEKHSFQSCTWLGVNFCKVLDWKKVTKNSNMVYPYPLLTDALWGFICPRYKCPEHCRQIKHLAMCSVFIFHGSITEEAFAQIVLFLSLVACLLACLHMLTVYVYCFLFHV